MLTQQSGKPRLSYAEFIASQQVSPKDRPGTVAWILERYLVEMNGLDGRPPVRLMKSSQLCILRKMQREPIGRIMVRALNHRDVIEFARQRQREGVTPQTTMQYFTYLAGALRYAGSAWQDCDGIADGATEAARAYLVKHNLIGKGKPRHQRPTPAQLATLSAYFAKQNKHRGTKTDMVKVLRWQNASSRRIGETCELLWLNWKPDDQTIFVRNMKDPKGREKNKTLALTTQAQEMLFELAWEMNANPASWNKPEPRIFPYNAKTCSARHTLAKQALGKIDPSFLECRMHDNRRDRGSRLVEDDGYSAEEAIQFTGHDTTAVFQRTYMKLDPAKIAKGPVSRRAA